MMQNLTILIRFFHMEISCKKVAKRCFSKEYQSGIIDCSSDSKSGPIDLKRWQQPDTGLGLAE
jgi:hypothetical protein